METTETMVCVNDVRQPWIANHLVEVTQTMIPTTQRYCADWGEWLLGYKVTNRRT